MDEIKKAYYDLLKNDATLQGLTGYTASDPRIYEWFPPMDVPLSATYPAFILYRVANYGRSRSYVDRAELGDIFLHLDIYARDSDTKGNVALRIRNILDLYGAVTTVSYRILQAMIEEDFEMPIEGESSSDRRYRHHLTVGLMGVLSRTAIGNVL